jgi:aspartate racemase
MKTIGIIGGLSPESTIEYYNGINAYVNKALGGHHNARILLASVDFGEFVALKEKGDWATQEKILCQQAQNLEKGGADFFVLATNTMHKMADAIAASVDIPFLHLADATADEILKSPYRKIGLLGTKYTMTLDFYKQRLEQKGLEVIVPDQEGISTVNDVIYNELCHGKIIDSSRQKYQKIIKGLKTQGCEAVILGCTEITMLISEADSTLPVFDTTKIHIQKAAHKSLV